MTEQLAAIVKDRQMIALDGATGRWFAVTRNAESLSDQANQVATMADAGTEQGWPVRAICEKVTAKVGGDYTVFDKRPEQQADGTVY